MKATGLKLICERADGEITTWHDVFETTVEEAYQVALDMVEESPLCYSK